MIRPVLLAALFCFSLAQLAGAADTGQSAGPGQSAAPGQAGSPGQSAGPGQAAGPGQSAGPGQDAQPGAQPQPESEPQPEEDVSTPPAATASGVSFADGVTVEEIAELVRDAGYRAEIKVDSSNYPYVSSRAAGLNFWINFYGCEGEPQRCWDLEFQTSLETNAEEQAKAKQWAVDKVFGKAYIIDDTTYFTMPVRVAGGVTAENIINNIELWDSVMGEFTAYIGWK